MDERFDVSKTVDIGDGKHVTFKDGDVGDNSGPKIFLSTWDGNMACSGWCGHIPTPHHLYVSISKPITFKKLNKTR